LTAFADHITESGIVAIAFQKNPDMILWCIMDDGTLASMTYERDQNVVAWARHPFQDGVTIESVAVIPGDTEDEVWLVAVRSIGGSTKRYIERMSARNFDTQADAFFVDCGLKYIGSASSTFSGLDHLEGETVSILGDGAVFANETVTGGAVTIESAVTKASIGLPYRYTLKPMRLDINSGRGSSQGSYKKIAEAVISFLETGGAQYGKDTDNLFDVPWCSTEVYGSPPNLFTGMKTVPVDGGFDPQDPFVISGNGPLPCTVRSITVRLEVPGR
jgi:hypothetical protein